MATYINRVNVSPSFLLSVKEALGYPIIDDEVIQSLYSDENIIQIVISDALEVFYNYFPIVEELTFMASGSTSETEVEAPKNTLGLVHYTFIDTTSSFGGQSLNTGNPFFTQSQLLFGGQGSSVARNYGTPFNYNGGYSSYQEKFYSESVANMNKVYYVKFDEENNKLKMKSSISGSFVIRVGKYSEDVCDIPKRLAHKFLEYCRGLLKVKFASTMLMMNSDLPLEFDRDTILDEGKEAIEQIENWYIENSTIPLMR